MSARTKIGMALVVVAAVGAWWFLPLPRAPLATAPATVQTSRPQPAVPNPAPPPSPPVVAAAPPLLAAPAPASNVLNESALVGSTWGRDEFNIEFGADGQLFIGGQPRAQWQIVGSRIRLYREDTGEEHWLDIVSNQLMWNGQELGRVRSTDGE